MARSTYRCGGKGRYGNPPKPCTICGRPHPKGKKQKEEAVKKGWVSCKTFNIRKISSQSGGIGEAPRFTPDELIKRAAKMQGRAARNAEAKANRIAAQKSKKKQSPQERIATLDARLGKGVGAKRERVRLAEDIKD